LFLGVIVLTVTAVIAVFAFLYITNYKQNILASCVSHDGSETESHYHAQLTIEQDGEKVKIPANIGIVKECIHPLHTHNTTGLVHVQHPPGLGFTLGDFFDVQGIVLKDDQIGSIQTKDGYSIDVTVDGVQVKSGFQNILLKDREKIDIKITSLAK